MLFILLKMQLNWFSVLILSSLYIEQFIIVVFLGMWSLQRHLKMKWFRVLFWTRSWYSLHQLIFQTANDVIGMANKHMTQSYRSQCVTWGGDGTFSSSCDLQQDDGCRISQCQYQVAAVSRSPSGCTRRRSMLSSFQHDRLQSQPKFAINVSPVHERLCFQVGEWSCPWHPPLQVSTISLAVELSEVDRAARFMNWWMRTKSWWQSLMISSWFPLCQIFLFGLGVSDVRYLFLDGSPQSFHPSGRMMPSNWQ